MLKDKDIALEIAVNSLKNGYITDIEYETIKNKDIDMKELKKRSNTKTRLFDKIKILLRGA